MARKTQSLPRSDASHRAIPEPETAVPTADHPAQSPAASCFVTPPPRDREGARTTPVATRDSPGQLHPEFVDILLEPLRPHRMRFDVRRACLVACDGKHKRRAVHKGELQHRRFGVAREGSPTPPPQGVGIRRVAPAIPDASRKPTAWPRLQRSRFTLSVTPASPAGRSTWTRTRSLILPATATTSTPRRRPFATRWRAQEKHRGGTKMGTVGKRARLFNQKNQPYFI